LTYACPKNMDEVMRVGSGESRAVALKFIGDPTAAGHQFSVEAKRSSSAKDVLHLPKKRALLWLVLDTGQAIQFLQQLALTLGELAGNLGTNLDE